MEIFMLTGKEYLESINNAISEDIETEMQRLEYFIKSNYRAKNNRYPFQFLVKCCRWEVIEALSEYLESNGWTVEKTKDFLYITPASKTSTENFFTELTPKNKP